ncbi:MAG: S-layer homology domain-containing protein [Clostridia bacterium]|nr:S-layer homology domain-containing protein [Clostridia bacterium]
MIKRIFSIAAAALMLASCAVFSRAENDLILVHTGAWNARVTGYNECDERLDLYGYDLTQDVITEIADRAFEGCATLKELVLPPTLESIGRFAFADCSELASAEIPYSVTYIGTSAFAGTDIEYIVLPETVEHFGYDIFGVPWEGFTVGVYSGSEALEYCEKSGYDVKILDAGCSHKHTENITLYDPTCTAGGRTALRCADCGKLTEISETAPYGHRWGARTDIGGHTARVCASCGETEDRFTSELSLDDLGYADIARGKWYTAGMVFCIENGLISGTSGTTASPSVPLTRAMAVRILSQLCGADLSGYKKQIFKDVPAGKWYTASVGWAADNGVANGYSSEIFAPGDKITREQFAVMLYKFNSKYGKVFIPPEPNAIDGFADLPSVHKWAKEALCWAVENRLVSGTSASTLSPRMTLDRAQASVIFKNYAKGFISPDPPLFKRVVIFGADGAGNAFDTVNTPNINSIFTAYTYSATAETPTNSAENWGSMLRGVAPDIHGIAKDNVTERPVSSRNGYPSVFRLIRERYPDAGISVFSTWGGVRGVIENDIGVYLHTKHTDDVRMTQDALIPYLDENDPKVLFVQFDNIDSAGECDAEGYGGTFYKDQIGLTDGLIGEVYKKYSELGRLEGTLFVLVSDHGGTGGKHGGNTPEETTVFIGFGGEGVIPAGLPEGMRGRDAASAVLEALAITPPAYFTSVCPDGLFEKLCY